jgi:hypothetical protein
MYKVHKEDDKRKQLENRPENFNKTDDPEAITSNGKDDGTIFANRFGSNRRNSQFRSRQSMGVINTGFISGEDKVIQEAVDILGDLPALHMEHCKL